MLDRYAKVVVGIVVAIAAAGYAALQDGQITAEELGGLVTGLAVLAGGIWAVPKEWLGAGKAIAAALGTGFTMWQTANADGVVSGNEWYGILAAVVGAISVWFTPNEEPPVPEPVPVKVV